MDQQATIENLRWWSQVYLWLAIGIPILGAIASDLLNIKRQHIEAKVRELSAELTEQALRAVEAHQRPRTLTAVQRRLLIQQLGEGSKGRFEILVAISDPEADHFARQFDQVLKDAGWTREKSGFGSTYLDEDYQTQLLVGLMIDVSRADLAPHREFLRHALHTAGLDISIRIIPEVPETLVRLVVGHKPWPQYHKMSQQEQQP
jgi:hypothetical protein